MSIASGCLRLQHHPLVQPGMIRIAGSSSLGDPYSFMPEEPSGGIFPGERMVNCRWFATDTEGLPNFSPEWQDVGVGGTRLEVCQVLNKI